MVRLMHDYTPPLWHWPYYPGDGHPGPDALPYRREQERPSGPWSLPAEPEISPALAVALASVGTLPRLATWDKMHSLNRGELIEYARDAFGTRHLPQPLSLTGAFQAIHASLLHGIGIGPSEAWEAIHASEGREYHELNVSALVSPFEVYHAVPAIKRLIDINRPVAVGLSIPIASIVSPAYESGRLPTADPGEHVRLGACFLLIGWDDSRQSFLGLSPTDAAWGQGGVGLIPYSYVTSLTDCHEIITLSDLTITSENPNGKASEENRVAGGSEMECESPGRNQVDH